MSITRIDETELLTVLHEGLHESPRWGNFLARLRGRTRADYTGLIFGQGDAPVYRATHLHAGHNIRAAAERIADLAALDPIPYARLRPGRVYSTDELVDPDDPRHTRFRQDYLESIGVRHGRFMRVVEPDGASLWAILAHTSRDFSAADSALLGALAPHLTIALRNLVRLEQERFRADVAEDALGRAGISWAAIGPDGRSLAATPAAPTALLRAGSLATASGPGSEVRAAGEGIDPPLDILCVETPGPPLAAGSIPVAVLLARQPPPLGDRQADALVALHGLTRSEALLALLLAEGRSIAQGAATLGLTLETARNYSKRIFLKTGTSGQPQLVRLILTSALTLG